MIRRATERSVASGPPLSVGRLRQNSSRDPHMHWRGVGLTACVGTFDLDGGAEESSRGRAVPTLLRESPAPGAAFGAPPESTRTARSRRVLTAFFEAGGRELVVLDDARFSAATHWIGDDGGPGRRTGIFGLLDMQEVSTLVVLTADADARRRVLGVAHRRTDKLFLFPAPTPAADGDSGAGHGRLETEPVSFLLPNAAEVGPLPDRPVRDDRAERPAASSAGRDNDRAPQVDGWRDLGVLAAMLDGTDFSDQPRFRRRPSGARWPEPSPGMVRLMAWRRWEGLRRSIELGSRWIVMELHHPLVWRHVERDVRGFLHRMAEYGLVQRPGHGSSGFEVRCTPRSAQGAVVPAVDIHVSVRLKPPYDLALPAAPLSGSDPDRKLDDAPRSAADPRDANEAEGKDPVLSGGEELS